LAQVKPEAGLTWFGRGIILRVARPGMTGRLLCRRRRAACGGRSRPAL